MSLRHQKRRKQTLGQPCWQRNWRTHATKMGQERARLGKGAHASSSVSIPSARWSRIDATGGQSSYAGASNVKKCETDCARGESRSPRLRGSVSDLVVAASRGFLGAESLDNGDRKNAFGEGGDTRVPGVYFYFFCASRRSRRCRRPHRRVGDSIGF